MQRTGITKTPSLRRYGPSPMPVTLHLFHSENTNEDMPKNEYALTVNTR